MNPGFQFFGSQLTLVQMLSSAGTLGDEPGDVFAILMLIALLNPKITGITEYSLLVTMEKVSGGHNVVNVGGRGVDAVNQAKSVINADVHLHAKVPLVAFPSLMHLRIALAALILGGTRCRNDGGVHYAAFTQHQTVLLQMLVHFLEQHLAKTVVFQEMPELEDGGLVIPPFLAGLKSRPQAIMANFCCEVIPPSPILGRS